jgi:aryl-alcohol dehydrogenase-like predicted oxidoreductase
MIPKAMFGRSGHLSTRAIFGAAALWSVDQAVADHTLAILLEFGVNHIDTAASYGDSELRLGPWMARHRQDFFLATKVEERSKAQAWESIRRSLARLRVEQVDLLQLHNVSSAEIWETVMGKGGALEAVLEAQQQGLTRFIGITGHGAQAAALHLRALDRVDFDSVLLPYTYAMMQNRQYAAEFERLVALCQERNVAMQAIKAITRGPWGARPHTRTTWYEPLEDQADIDQAVHWLLYRPELFLNTAGDVDLLPRILAASGRFSAAAVRLIRNRPVWPRP